MALLSVCQCPEFCSYYVPSFFCKPTGYKRTGSRLFRFFFSLFFFFFLAIFLVSLCVFALLSNYLRGSADRKIFLFSGVPRLFCHTKKKQGLEGQGCWPYFRRISDLRQSLQPTLLLLLPLLLLPLTVNLLCARYLLHVVLLVRPGFWDVFKFRKSLFLSLHKKKRKNTHT